MVGGKDGMNVLDGGTCWPKANPGDQKGAEPPFLAGKLAERSDSDAKQAFQLVTNKILYELVSQCHIFSANLATYGDVSCLIFFCIFSQSHM